MTNQISDAFLTPEDGLTSVVKAVFSGRTIVPLIGAGISTESGVPSTSQLIPYLANVSELLRRSSPGSEW